jgi:hypothetical protein
MNLIFVGDAVVSMGDIEAAIQEVFQAPHIQVSGKCAFYASLYS